MNHLWREIDSDSFYITNSPHKKAPYQQPQTSSSPRSVPIEPQIYHPDTQLIMSLPNSPPGNSGRPSWQDQLLGKFHDQLETIPLSIHWVPNSGTVSSPIPRFESFEEPWILTNCMKTIADVTKLRPLSSISSPIGEVPTHFRFLFPCPFSHLLFAPGFSIILHVCCHPAESDPSPPPLFPPLFLSALFHLAQTCSGITGVELQKRTTTPTFTSEFDSGC